MRIGIVTDCYPPHIGGIETQTYNLAQQLKQAGHQVEVITATRAGSFVGRRIEDQIPVHRLGMPTIGFTPMNPFAGPLFRAIFPHFDLLHVHIGVLSPFAHLALQVAAQGTIPTLATFHCELSTWAPLMRASGFFDRLVEAGVLFSGVSSLMNTQINQVLQPRNRRHWPIIPNGVDTNFWAANDQTAQKSAKPAPAANSEGLPTETANLGGTLNFEAVSAIRLMPRKRPFALIKFAQTVNDLLGSRGNFSLKIFGEGALLPLLLRQPQLATGQVSLAGRQDADGLLNAYRQTDFFITLCLHESFGIAAAEARASGLPVIVRSQSPITDFITEGVTGITADTDQKLAEKTAAALLNGKLKNLRDNCKRQPSPVSWERCLQATLAAYEQAREYRR
ncbi:glycosyltransferase family 4 protein [uncultured Varibaculum sp.]|uniref:glycosyltransferase family 4 protein n=1 Tax=uncultured Varibaculum sp. TaxID=413896 RepID=UPI00258AF013|nr:glycosyltransferase family 4 protein [uncultured Varibaculum sp.]